MGPKTLGKNSGFNFLTDGYAFFPFKFKRSDLTFVPQLFASPHGLPIGIYTNCCHLDNMQINQIDNLIREISKYNIISFEEASKYFHPYGTEKLSRKIAEILIYSHRKFKKIKNKK